MAEETENESGAETGARQAKDTEFEANTELFSDYYEGALDAKARARLKELITNEARYTTAYAEFEKTMELLSGMHKMSAPVDFDKRVEGTIHRRSGGRFFGKRAFGNKIPFEFLAIVVMVIAGLVYWMGRGATGGHKFDADAPSLSPEIRDEIPTL